MEFAKKSADATRVHRTRSALGGKSARILNAYQTHNVTMMKCVMTEVACQVAVFLETNATLVTSAKTAIARAPRTNAEDNLTVT